MILEKEKHKSLIRELDERVCYLRSAFRARELTSNREGIAGRGSWVHPEHMSATTGTSLEVRLAIADFKAILAEISRLK